ncbi:MAG: MFS transporter [Armatimonadetes bacterium]|nr:MFS transporter [Armatimonadota bacterium]
MKFIKRYSDFLSVLPISVRKAWFWDASSGITAGIYQGLIWTFVMRIARANLHVSSFQIGLMTSAGAFGYLFSAVWARMMEGRSKLPFVYVTWLVARGIFIFSPLIISRNIYVVLTCTTPIVFSISAPAYTAVIQDIYPEQWRGRLMSATRVLAQTATLLTALIVGRLLDRGLNFHNAFTVGGAFGAASAICFSRISMVKVHRSDEPLPGFKAFLLDTLNILRRNVGFRWFTASIFIYGFGNLIAQTLYPIYQVDRFNITNTVVANMQNITAILMIFSYIAWGHYIDRKGPLAAVVLAVTLVAIQPIVYIFANDVRWLYLASAAGGIAFSGIDVGYINSIILFSDEGRASQYQSVHSSAFGIRGTVAPMVAVPLMLTIGYLHTFWVCFAMILTGGALQLILLRDYRKLHRQMRAQRYTDPETAA